MHKVTNAIIMAAGTSSRFAPLSYEIPKALISVKGEILIERQIRQLQEAGIKDIYIVTGYKSEMFSYLEEKFGVRLVHNPEYLTRNNHASIWVVKDYLKNSYICSADNYFNESPFESEVASSYYAAVYAKGETKEWCLEYDENEIIKKVTIGGENAWYMLGHTFWNAEFSNKFIKILELEYDLPQTHGLLWESIYANHLDELKMKIRRYPDDMIFEFDTLDELRKFDTEYITNTHSTILKWVCKKLEITEADIENASACKDGSNEAVGFTFYVNGQRYKYIYNERSLVRE